IAEAALEPVEDGIAHVPPHTDDERGAETLGVGGVEPPANSASLNQSNPKAALLAARLGRERDGEGHLPGQIGVSRMRAICSASPAAVAAACVAAQRSATVAKGRAAEARSATMGLLVDAAQRREEAAAVQAVELIEGYGHPAGDERLAMAPGLDVARLGA